MKTKWYNDIIFWLKPPFHSIEQGTKIVLNDEQKRHVESGPGQHQRLRGVAGSGKTLVLAQRAANLASEGKRVLIITFNVTLWHYIRDHVSRAQRNFTWTNIEFNHFHGFCRDYLLENDQQWPQSEKKCNEIFFNITVPKVVTTLLKHGMNKKQRKYDAILIDEGQDFQKEWYQMLCLFLTDNDEVFFTIDERQNIYKKDHSWVDSMTETKFKGRWRILKGCYRVPDEILSVANGFSRQFLPNVDEEPVHNSIQGELFTPHFVWANVDNDTEIFHKVLKVINWLTHKKNIHPSDIVVLTPTHDEGWQLVRLFEENHYQINHVFEDDSSYRRNKKSFWMGDSRLKMCTIHSFKGWELLNVILLIPQNGNDPKTDFLVYTSITRTRQNLIVFNRNDRYNEFGTKFPRLNWN